MLMKQLRIKSNAIKTCRFWQRLVTNLLFSSIYTLHSNSLPTSIPDILSASPPPSPSLKRFCDTRISSRYIINSGEIHFAGKMIQWAKIICLITGGYYSLFFLCLLFFFCFFIKLKGLYCTKLLEGLFSPSGTGIILLLKQVTKVE